MSYDPDEPDPRFTRILQRLLESPLKRIRAAILEPKGGSPESIEWNRSRSIQTWNRVQEELTRTGKAAADWTGKALSNAGGKGWREGRRQLDAMSPAWRERGLDPSLKAGFNVLNLDAVKVLARDTFEDLRKVLQSTGELAQKTLRKFADIGLTAAEVNTITAGRMIEGKPREMIRDIRQALEAIHGEKLTITQRDGSTRECETGDYAQMLAHTRMREVSVIARHERLGRSGVDHVVIIGNITRHPCTAYLGKIYFIGEGEDPEGYPRLDTLEDGRGHAAPPFHPNCSKSTAPIVLELATPQQIKLGEQDSTSEKMAEVGMGTAGVRLMQADNVQGQATARMNKINASIRGQARDEDEKAPPWAK